METKNRGIRLSKYLFAFMILLMGTASASNIRGVENVDIFGHMNVSQSWLCVDDDQAGCSGTTAGTAYANDFVCNSAGCIGKEELGTSSVEADEIASGAVTAAGTELDSTVAGDGIGLSGGAITVQVNTTSGLELFNDRISLIGSCDDEEVLSWDNDAGTWGCVAMGAYDDTDLWANASDQEGDITTLEGEVTDLWTNASVQESFITAGIAQFDNLWTNASVQETNINGKVAKAGDTMTGNLDISDYNVTTGDNGWFIGNGTFLTDLDAAISDIWINEDGDTMTGELIIDDQLNVTGDFYLGGDMYGSGADIAEKFDASEKMEAGDVVIINNMVISKSNKPYDMRAIGVVSTDPMQIMAIERNGYPIAMAGTTPVKVTDEGGKIQSGDLLTTASKDGYAMRCESREKCSGAIIGKSLQDFKGGRGTIRMLVMMA